MIENTLTEDRTMEEEFMEYCSVQAIAKIPDLKL